MGHRFADITFTPEAHARDSFYMASITETGCRVPARLSRLADVDHQSGEFAGIGVHHKG